jgi:hypothetical protein
MAGLLDYDKLLSDPMLQIGLGLLGNNTGHYGQFAPAFGAGVNQGMGNVMAYRNAQQDNQLRQQQADMQRQQFEMQKAQMQRQLDTQNKRDAAMPRLLGGQSGYMSMQQTPVQRTQNVPIPATAGAQAPNFGLMPQTTTEMQQTPQFDNARYMQDMVDAGFGDELIKQQLQPKKYTYQDVGNGLMQMDDNGQPTGTMLPKGISPEQLQKFEWEQFKFRNPSASDLLSNQATLRGQNITIRGQNMTDARSKESNATGKAPAGYRWLPNGDMEPIPGGPGSNKATTSEGERKAATLLQRLEGSMSQLDTVLKSDPRAAKPELLSSGIRTLTFGADAPANAATSSNRQRVEAAQLDMLDAALTLGTGAAYTKEQLEGYRKSYFPQLGDSQQTVADKQDRLNNVIEAAKIAAGRAAPDYGDKKQLLPKNSPMPNARSKQDILKQYGVK